MTSTLLNDDFMLDKFLHSCYGSIEQTKKCIEKFCTTRSMMTEVYTGRDPMSEDIQTAFSITNVSTYEAGDQEILIHQFEDPTLEKFQYYDVLKSFSIQADMWVKEQKFLPEGHIIILDLNNYSLRMIPRVNIFFFREFLIYLLEAMPVRVKEIYTINAPSFVDKLLALVKPALPSQIYDMLCHMASPALPFAARLLKMARLPKLFLINLNITFENLLILTVNLKIRILPDSKSLHQYIDKKYLPMEYGGEAESTKEQHAKWVDLIQNQRPLLHDDMWKADLKKKPKTNSFEDSMNGSFKTLCID